MIPKYEIRVEYVQGGSLGTYIKEVDDLILYLSKLVEDESAYKLVIIERDGEQKYLEMKENELSDV